MFFLTPAERTPNQNKDNRMLNIKRKSGRDPIAQQKSQEASNKVEILSKISEGLIPKPISL
jgi:hypothetical protein